MVFVYRIHFIGVSKVIYEDAAKIYDNMTPDDNIIDLIEPEEPMEDLDGGDFV